MAQNDQLDDLSDLGRLVLTYLFIYYNFENVDRPDRAFDSERLLQDMNLLLGRFGRPEDVEDLRRCLQSLQVRGLTAPGLGVGPNKMRDVCLTSAGYRRGEAEYRSAKSKIPPEAVPTEDESGKPVQDPERGGKIVGMFLRGLARGLGFL